MEDGEPPKAARLGVEERSEDELKGWAARMDYGGLVWSGKECFKRESMTYFIVEGP